MTAGNLEGANFRGSTRRITCIADMFNASATSPASGFSNGVLDSRLLVMIITIQRLSRLFSNLSETICV